jgi:2-keto-4-pentenoate hydratase
MSEAELIRLLADAQRSDTHAVDAKLFANLDRAAGMIKTGISDGIGVAAPIYSEFVGRNGSRLTAGNVRGLEVEVGLVLGKDVPTGIESIRPYVDHYFTGAEIVGSRFADQTKFGLNGGMADNMSSLGYVIGVEPRPLADVIDGLTVRLEFNGTQIYAAPAKHGFGTVLASVTAYANSQFPAYPLRAGTIITTGSLCGLVPTSGLGHVVAWLGDERMEFDLV